MRRAKDGELEAAASGPAPQDGSRARRKAKLSFQYMSWEEKLAPRFNFLSVDSFSGLSSNQCYHSCYPLSPRKGHLEVPSTRPSPSRTGVLGTSDVTRGTSNGTLINTQAVKMSYTGLL